jgi:hypothetical protein
MYVRIVAQNEFRRSCKRLYLPQLALPCGPTGSGYSREAESSSGEVRLSPEISEVSGDDCWGLSRSAANIVAENNSKMSRRPIARIHASVVEIIVPAAFTLDTLSFQVLRSVASQESCGARPSAGNFPRRQVV